MKSLSLVLGVTLASISSFAGSSGSLDGRSYCRTVISDGYFGQPKGERQHCISFKNGVATDNSNTFFGNPPKRYPYATRGLQVMFDNSTYSLSAQKTMLKTIRGSTTAGTVFKLVVK
jgi:hypothetical protein